MNIVTSSRGSWTLFILSGKLDNTGSDELKRVLAPHLVSGGAIALDFGGIEYVTSSGFRVLMQAEKELRLKNGRLLLGNLSKPVAGFMEIAGLHTLFKIVPDLKAAIPEQA